MHLAHTEHLTVQEPHSRLSMPKIMQHLMCKRDAKGNGFFAPSGEKSMNFMKR